MYYQVQHKVKMDWNAYAHQHTLTPEQQQLYLKQQQEQWFEYQRQYATWNASYGEQVRRVLIKSKLS